jgi:hypothetical protein
MAASPGHTRTELAHRANGGVEVTLFWVQCEEADKAVVCVRDRREGVCFEVMTNAHLALDVYYHPFAYRALGAIENDDSWLAA